MYTSCLTFKSNQTLMITFADILVSFVELATIMSFLRNFELKTHGPMFLVIWLCYKIFIVSVLFVGGPYFYPLLQPMLGAFIARELILICIEVVGIMFFLFVPWYLDPNSPSFYDLLQTIFGFWWIYKIAAVLSIFFEMLFKRAMEEKSQKIASIPAVDMVSFIIFLSLTLS